MTDKIGIMNCWGVYVWGRLIYKEDLRRSYEKNL